ncbi:unnamed protein product [Anisakis simplex]|uniref:EGF CA and hEGF domain containing protein n=1 Tax=Anisakis simplex TaxID=6269 RepID=A0A0M3JRL1_ANISI|nr:unnamed protein product [Anisakis simplex]
MSNRNIQVTWRKDQCFDIYTHRLNENLCAFGQPRANTHAHVGVSCDCNQPNGIGDGFRCTEDLCSSCKFACHKASKCLPPTMHSEHGYTCAKCDPSKGYTGDGFTCKDIDECSDETLSKCDRPNAVCVNKRPIEDNGLKYSCECKEGWRGDPDGGYEWRKCKDTNECALRGICGKNAKCVNTPGSYYCSCFPGFAKANKNRTYECFDIDECQMPNRCTGNSRCLNTEGGYECVCKKGFIESHDNTLCIRTFIALIINCTFYKCVCKDGFTTQQSTDPNRCVHIQNCMDPALNDCDKRPGYASCIELPGSYECKCNNGFSGDGKQCTRNDFSHCDDLLSFFVALNPCVRHNPCASIAGTECFNEYGRAKCKCKQGFVKSLKNALNPNAPCFDETSAAVRNCSFCDNATSFCERIFRDQPYYTCKCVEGYQMNAAGKCTNINECLRMSENDCDPNAKCIDKQPAIDGVRFKCECKTGFTGSGKIGQCHDIDECKGFNGVCPFPNQICRNTIGSYQCDCDKGYQHPPGLQSCTTINECEQGIAVCPQYSRCEDLDHGYVCRCLPGFINRTENGEVVCANIDECIVGLGPDAPISACDPLNGICKDTLGSYLCACQPGFELQSDGRTCVDRNECEDGSNKCLQHSKCVNLFGSYKCECEHGFTPAVATHSLRPKCQQCSRSICRQLSGENMCVKYSSICGAGKCTSIDKAPFYRCMCSPPLISINSTKCVYPNYCDEQFKCPSHSTCANNECACASGYYWRDTDQFPPTIQTLKNRSTNCQEINLCAEGNICADPLNCKHAGPGRYECVCGEGYEKVPAEQGYCIDIDECNLDANALSCPVNSHCENLQGGYQCSCNKGYTPSIGRTDFLFCSSLTDPECVDMNECDAGIDDCESKNATCTNTIGSFECVCADGFRHEAPNYNVCSGVNIIFISMSAAMAQQNATKMLIVRIRWGHTNVNAKKAISGTVPFVRVMISDVDECNPADPRNNCNKTTQLCDNLPGSYKCICRKGYRSVQGGCQDINECLSSHNNDCAKRSGDVHMKCVNDEGSYHCVCPRGYFENANGICEDINECNGTPSPCPPTPVDLCVNTPGSFNCTCKQGFKKPSGCRSPAECPCVDVDECKEGILMNNGSLRSACGTAAKCSNTLGGYTCTCAPGYDGDAYLAGCKVSDICEAANPCDKNTQVCEQDNGKTFCKCKIGFLSINEYECGDNPCAYDKGVCGQNATCHPKRDGGKYIAQCLCEQGHQLDQHKNCVPIDYCSCKTEPKTSQPCKSDQYCTADNMLCMNTGKLYNCTCETGYRLNASGTTCEISGKDRVMLQILTSAQKVLTQMRVISRAIHPLDALIPKSQLSRCCERSEYFVKISVDTPNCSREKNCIGDVNAYCAQINDSHRYCQCKAGYDGDAIPGGIPCKPHDYCKEARKVVDGEPCSGHEVCVNQNTSYSCECKIGFQRLNPGDECKARHQTIQIADRLMQEVVVERVVSSLDVLMHSFKMKQEVLIADVDECVFGSVSCRETYQCKNTIGSFECVCPDGYRKNDTTQLCKDIDECVELSQICNTPEERCVNVPGNYRCECNQPAYISSGEYCVDHNECITNEYNCPLFSTCVNTVGGYNCTCKRGFRIALVKDDKVALCEDIDECAEDKNACPSHSKCINRPGTWECLCEPPAIQRGTRDCVMSAKCPECHEHAHCLRSERPGGNIYNCTCDVGYTGDGVHTCNPIDECTLGIAKCHVHAECIDLTPLFECRCKAPYYTGDGTNQCNSVDLCLNHNDCPSDAQCVSLDERSSPHLVTCICPKGFIFNNSTRNCEARIIHIICLGIRLIMYFDDSDIFNNSDIDECASIDSASPCAAMPVGTSCINTQGSFFCKCPAGYLMNASGTLCDDIDECRTPISELCAQSGGICSNNLGSYECVCPPGLRPSAGKQRCVDVNECMEGIDDCDKKTTSCFNTYSGYMCICNSGLVHVPQKTNVCEDIDECTLGMHSCTALSETCVNTNGGFYCECSKGYRRNEYNNCVPNNVCDQSVRCGRNALCVMRPSEWDPNDYQPTCICKDGYFVSQFRLGKNPEVLCEPINECNTDDQCTANAHCETILHNIGMGKFYQLQATYEVIAGGQGGVETMAMHKCICDNGYRLKGTLCEQINECIEQPSICGIDATCVDLEPFYKCVCAPGMVNVAQGSEMIQCEPMSCENTISACHPDAKCENIDGGGYRCECPAGFVGAGTPNLGCESVTSCRINHQCSKYATCVNGNGTNGISCVCNPGFSGDGFTCNDVDECLTNDVNICDSNATCINSQGSFSCKCAAGYEGDGSPGNCKDINECSSPVLNKCDSSTSICRNNDGSFECVCLAGYEHVGDNPNLRGDYRCDCAEGYQNTKDQHSCIDIDECKRNNPCAVNAICSNTVGSFSCSCADLFEGDGSTHCNPIDQCKNSTLNICDPETTVCTMIEGQALYRCVCKQGFKPLLSSNEQYRSCEDINECNGGYVEYDATTQDCINTVGSFEIRCKKGYRLKKSSGRCVDIDECAEDPAYGETLLRFQTAVSSGYFFKMSDWKQWVVRPAINGSAYSICYERAMRYDNWWWFSSASSVLPFCRNGLYQEHGVFAEYYSSGIIQGFECDCVPGQIRRQGGTAQTPVLTCDGSSCLDIDVCVYLNCSSSGEGWICDRMNRKCLCDSASGYMTRFNARGIPYCTKHECTELDTTGPVTVKNAMYRSLFKCDLKTHRWIQPAGFIIVRDVVTSVIIGLEDINECEYVDYCCNRTSSSNNDASRFVKCINFEGGASCQSKCSVNSAWYLKCDGNSLICDYSKWQKLLDAPTAPKGTVCSRLTDANGVYMDFPSMHALVTELCKSNFYCAMPPHPINDIRMLPTFNYEGKCIVNKSQLSRVKCPFGDSPLALEGYVGIYAFCPYKFNTTEWPGANPSYPKREGKPMQLSCLPDGLHLSKTTQFFQLDVDSYSMETL